jgi:acetyl-CoA decarbonylase/synthase complex subunit delta
LAFQVNKVKYSGKINEVPLGTQKVMVGGQSAYNFHDFEGTFPHKPLLALQVWDMDPGDSFAEPLNEAYKGVLNDPAAWAKKAQDYGADLISLELVSTDPNDADTSPEQAAEIVGKVLGAINVPLIVSGVDNKDKDVETLSLIAEKFQNKNLILGPVTEKNYKQIAAQALAYGHSIIAKSPIDVNLAKQLNILIMDLGMTADRILIDPTTSGLGYGLEYTYSIIERINMAALVQQDDKLQQPIISIIGRENWKCKEANLPTEGNETMGEQAARGVLMEVTTAISFLAAGSTVIVFAHPESLQIVRAYIDSVMDGGAIKADNIPAVPITAIPDQAAPAVPEAKKEEPKAAAAEAPKAEAPKAAAEAPKAAEAKAAPAEKPAKAAKAAPKPKAEKAEPAKAAEPPKAETKVAEAPKAAAAPKAAEAKVAEAPKAAAASKVEEPKVDYVIANKIMAELTRVHVRVPRY